LIVRTVDQGGETALVSGPISQRLFTPAWSPDGKTIVCVILPTDALTGLMAVDANTGQQRLISSSQDALGLLIWMPDGKGLLALDSDRSTNYTRSQIVFVSYPDGQVTRITRDTNDYSDLSIAANGQVLVTVLNQGRWNLSVATAASGGADARPLAPVTSFANVNWMRDGRLISDSDNQLRWVNPESGAKGVFAIPANSVADDPWECSDGRTIVFLLSLLGGNGGQSVWRADTSGGNLKQLSNGKQDSYPVCSPDSHWAYYIDRSVGRLMKISLGSGTAEKVTDMSLSGLFDISPDGSTAVFATVDHANGHEEKLVLLDTNTREVRKQTKFERSRMGYFLRFSRDGKSLVYPVRENGVDNLWQQPLDGSPGRYLTSFKAEHIWGYDWSPDGSRLAVTQGHNDSDVVLMSDMQP